MLKFWYKSSLEIFLALLGFCKLLINPNLTTWWWNKLKHKPVMTPWLCILIPCQTSIPFTLVGHRAITTSLVLCASLVIYHLTSNACLWNNIIVNYCHYQYSWILTFSSHSATNCSNAWVFANSCLFLSNKDCKYMYKEIQIHVSLEQHTLVYEIMQVVFVLQFL